MCSAVESAFHFVVVLLCWLQIDVCPVAISIDLLEDREREIILNLSLRQNREGDAEGLAAVGHLLNRLRDVRRIQAVAINHDENPGGPVGLLQKAAEPLLALTKSTHLLEDQPPSCIGVAQEYPPESGNYEVQEVAVAGDVFDENPGRQPQAVASLHRRQLGALVA